MTDTNNASKQFQYVLAAVHDYERSVLEYGANENNDTYENMLSKYTELVRLNEKLTGEEIPVLVHQRLAAALNEAGQKERTIVANRLYGSFEAAKKAQADRLLAPGRVTKAIGRMLDNGEWSQVRDALNSIHKLLSTDPDRFVMLLDNIHDAMEARLKVPGHRLQAKDTFNAIYTLWLAEIEMESIAHQQECSKHGHSNAGGVEPGDTALEPNQTGSNSAQTLASQLST